MIKYQKLLICISGSLTKSSLVYTDVTRKSTDNLKLNFYIFRSLIHISLATTTSQGRRKCNIIFPSQLTKLVAFMNRKDFDTKTPTEDQRAKSAT